MFGTYRTLLALAVVATHLLRIPSLGPHAVHGFFILSGYLMTTIMHRSYGYTLRGVGSFALNRSLRLYPTYWAVLAIILTTMMIWGGGQLRSFHSAIYFPASWSEWAQNLSLIFPAQIPMEMTPRLVPPAWALTVELFYYILIALGISRSRKTTLVWVAASLGYLLFTHIHNLGYDSRYVHMAAGSLPFSLGALIFHYQDVLGKRLQRLANFRFLSVLGAGFVLNSLVAAMAKHFLHSEALQTLCLYLNLPINFLCVAILMTKPKLPIAFKIDKRIGDFSYPVYLSHWYAGFLASMLLFGHPARGLSPEGLASFALASIICIGISLLTIRLVDHPVERMRSKVKAALWRDQAGPANATKS
jgi:peptidoglycan/LPS O-acetylase OafA/YrhL